MKKIVITQFDLDGFHNYPNAPEKVDFLKFRHRHTFNIKVGYLVAGSDREKEIFLCRDEVIFYLNESYGSPCEFGSMSCEMIAQEILEFGSDDGIIWVEVFEEKTGGARVEL